MFCNIDNSPSEILRCLLIALGWEIQPNTNIIIDQMTKNQITCGDKFLKASIDPNKLLYISEHDVKLEPLNPKCTKMMEWIFAKFLDNESSEEIGNIPEVFSYSFDKDPETKKYQLRIVFHSGSPWTGNWYFNKIICFTEAIFSLEETFAGIDLRPYDIPKEELNQE